MMMGELKAMEFDPLVMMREFDAIERSEPAFMSDYIFTLDQYYQCQQQQQVPHESPNGAHDDAFLIQHWTDIHQVDFDRIYGAIDRLHGDGEIHMNDDDPLEDQRLMSSITDPPDHVPITSADNSIDDSKSSSSCTHSDRASNIVRATDDNPALLQPPTVINSTILRQFLIKKQPLAAAVPAGGSAAAADSTNHIVNHTINDKHELNTIEQDADLNLPANVGDIHADAKQASINGALKKKLKSKRRAQNMLSESLRRKQMTRLFHTLRDLLPNVKQCQNDRCVIVDEAVHHILSLERHRRIYAQVLRFLRRPRRCQLSKNVDNTLPSLSLRYLSSSSPSSSTSPSSTAGVGYDDDDDVFAPSVKISLVSDNKDSKNITASLSVQISIVCPTFLISYTSASNSACTACLGNNISRRPSLLDKLMSLLERRGLAILDATFSLGQQTSFYSFRAQILQESLRSRISTDIPAFLDNLEDDLILRVGSNLQAATFLNLL